MLNFEDVEERDGLFHCLNSLISLHLTLDFRCSSFVECMALFSDRGDSDCGPDISALYSIEAARGSSSSVIRTRDL